MIEWSSIDFEDNKDCLDLIEATKPPGVLALIDESCLVQVRSPVASSTHLLTSEWHVHCVHIN